MKVTIVEGSYPVDALNHVLMLAKIAYDVHNHFWIRVERDDDSGTSLTVRTKDCGGFRISFPDHRIGRHVDYDRFRVYGLAKDLHEVVTEKE